MMRSLYEVYKVYVQNKGRFISDDISSRMFISDTTGCISMTHFPDPSLTRLDFAGILFISGR